MSKPCALCGGPVEDDGVPIWTQMITEGEQTAPVVWKTAHLGCARMLTLEEDGDDDAEAEQ